MFSDAGYSRGDILPEDFGSGYTSSGFGSGDLFSNTFFTNNPSSEVWSTVEGSGTSPDTDTESATVETSETEAISGSDKSESTEATAPSTESGATEVSESVTEVSKTDDTETTGELNFLSVERQFRTMYERLVIQTFLKYSS